MGTWTRVVQAELPWNSNNSLILKVPRGSTLVRTRFAWGFYIDSQSTQDLIQLASNLMVLGLVTTVGNGTETVPDARTQSADQAPPAQRWLYWEARAPVIAAYSDRDSLVLWNSSEPQEPVDVKAMVSAKTIPAGDTLNLWASWNPGSVFGGQANAYLWYWASVLYQ